MRNSLVIGFIKGLRESARDKHVSKILEIFARVIDVVTVRVRDKQQTFYCYSDPERQRAIKKLRGKPEITRFKGLGEISPNEFGDFIGENIKLENVWLPEDTNLDHVLDYYMGKNTPERQEFIIENLRVENDIIDTPEEIAQIQPEKVMENA